MKNNFVEFKYIKGIAPIMRTANRWQTDSFGNKMYTYYEKYIYVNRDEILYFEQVKYQTNLQEMNIMEITLKNGEKFQAEGVVFELLNTLNEN